MSKYIAHRRCRCIAASGQQVNIPYGSEYEAFGEWIATGDGKAICAVHSEIAKRHFSVNDDGRGLERGALTWAIAFSARRRKCANGGVYRFSDEERKLLEEQWPHFLRDAEVIIFNDAFFAAEVPELEKLADALHIIPKVRR